ncbi:hypothetical protein Tco_0250344 [Tanacetum coccineum]
MTNTIVNSLLLSRGFLSEECMAAAQGTIRKILFYSKVCSYAQSTARCESSAVYVRRFTYKFDVTWIVQDIRHKFGKSTSAATNLLSSSFLYSVTTWATEFEIQEMVNIWVSGEAYCLIVLPLHVHYGKCLQVAYHGRPLLDDYKKWEVSYQTIRDLQFCIVGDMFKKILSPREACFLAPGSGRAPSQNFRGSWLYDEVRARTFFVLSSSNGEDFWRIIDLMRKRTKELKQEGLIEDWELQDSHGALDLGSTRYCSSKRRYCSKVLLLFESTAHYAQSTARCESTAVMFEGTASFIREGKIIMARIWRSIEEVIMKKIKYCLFDVVVEFHREMITSQLQGKLRLYDEVRARTLFVLSSSNRGRLLGIIDLMRQKNKRMKQEGLNRQIGKLQDVT